MLFSFRGCTLLGAALLAVAGLQLASPIFGNVQSQTLQVSGTVSYAEKFRFVLQKTDVGFLRLDRKNGEISLCKRSYHTWICRLVADEREAYLGEIERLSSERRYLAQYLDAYRKANGVYARSQKNGRSNEFSNAPNLRMPSEKEILAPLKRHEQLQRQQRELAARQETRENPSNASENAFLAKANDYRKVAGDRLRLAGRRLMRGFRRMGLIVFGAFAAQETEQQARKKSANLT